MKSNTQQERKYFEDQAKQGTLRGAIQCNPAAAVRVFGPIAVIASQCGTEEQARAAIAKATRGET